MTNGNIVNGIVTDKNSKRIVRENGFIHELTIKI